MKFEGTVYKFIKREFVKIVKVLHELHLYGCLNAVYETSKKLEGKGI